MNLSITVTQSDLTEVLLNVAPIRPVFIWGAPGIGKSALVEQFAAEIGLPCVSLLGSQLAPEDIIGIPRILDDVSEFLPPKMIARKEPYVLFLDELNACSQEVQKAFYSSIHEKRIGEYHLPKGSIVIGAGNRAQDSAIVKTMSSALVNRMFHVQLKADSKQWIQWAYENDILYNGEQIKLKDYDEYNIFPKTVFRFNNSKKFVGKYESPLIAEQITGVKRNIIQHSLNWKTKKPYKNADYWRYKEDVKESEENTDSLIMLR